MNNIKVLLCCIAKMENLYIREFVEHYKKLGFDNICLYDNNDPDGEYFEDVIGDYIKSGFVILKNKRGVQLAQVPSYTECYNEYKDQYDWIAFFDIDEFLHIDNGLNIKELLSKKIYNMPGVGCIKVNWKSFDDSGIVKTNGDYSVKKFKTHYKLVNKKTKGFNYLAPEASNCFTKPIIKTGINNLKFTSPHGPLNDNRLKCVNTAGVLCKNKVFNYETPTWENCCLHHYRFKTIEEYVLFKMIRLWPDKYGDQGKSKLNLDFFFRYNKKTPEKVEYAEKLIKKHNISRNE